jgi:uncharacterized membrane protein YbhN (UPF0104 family)
LRARAAVILLGLTALACASLALDSESLCGALRYATEHPAGLLAALGAYTGAFLLRAFSWRLFVPRWLPLTRLFGLLLAALFLNHVAPAKAGDLARVYAVAKQGVGVGVAAAGVILARLVDLVGLLAVLAFAWALAGNADWAAVAASGSVVAAAALAVWALTRVETIPPLGPISEPVETLRGALRETRPQQLGAAFLWAAPAWVLEAGVLLFAARGVGLDLSVAETVAATCFAVLVTAVPLTPGGLGTYEAGMVFILTSLGAPAEPAFAAAVLSHAIKYLYSMAGAPFAACEGVIATRPEDEIGERRMDSDEARLEV